MVQQNHVKYDNNTDTAICEISVVFVDDDEDEDEIISFTPLFSMTITRR